MPAILLNSLVAAGELERALNHHAVLAENAHQFYGMPLNI